jgi:cellulose synthase/poly-beta-1,6-N-acetylglucosamine synthase-like glycosyltransferase
VEKESDKLDGVAGGGGGVWEREAKEGAGLTVVIPTLGRETVVGTVKSLLATRGGEKLDIVVTGKIADQRVKGMLHEIMRLHRNVRHLEVQFETGDLCRKRDAGFSAGRGDIVAFVDDDVEMAEEWPEQLVSVFKDEQVGLASGPGLVPDGLNTVGRLAGLALASKGAGFVSRRYLGYGEGAYDAKWDEVIGCNHAYRRAAFEDIGGYPPEIYPGDDLWAAWRTTQAGWKIKYVPGAWVWHWPRQSLKGFWIQMMRYGEARIRLFRKGIPWRLSTLVPGLWVGTTLVLAFVGVWWRLAWALLGADLVAYALVAAWIAEETVRATKRLGDWRLWGMLWVMHSAYGLGEWLELVRPARDLSDPPVGVAGK